MEAAKALGCFDFSDEELNELTIAALNGGREMAR